TRRGPGVKPPGPRPDAAELSARDGQPQYSSSSKSCTTVCPLTMRAFFDSGGYPVAELSRLSRLLETPIQRAYPPSGPVTSVTSYSDPSMTTNAPSSGTVSSSQVTPVTVPAILPQLGGGVTVSDTSTR